MRDRRRALGHNRRHGAGGEIEHPEAKRAGLLISEDELIREDGIPARLGAVTMTRGETLQGAAGGAGEVDTRTAGRAGGERETGPVRRP